MSSHPQPNPASEQDPESLHDTVARLQREGAQAARESAYLTESLRTIAALEELRDEDAERVAFEACRRARHALQILDELKDAEPVHDSTLRQVAKWFAGRGTGISSLTMAAWLGFQTLPEDHDPPWDPADFNRCLLLLDAAPGLRQHLPLMRVVSARWAAIVEHWAEIESTFLAEAGLGWSKSKSAPRTYELMKRVHRQVEEAERP